MWTSVERCGTWLKVILADSGSQSFLNPEMPPAGLYRIGVLYPKVDFEFYNQRHRNQGLDRKIPDEVYIAKLSKKLVTV